VPQLAFIRDVNEDRIQTPHRAHQSTGSARIRIDARSFWLLAARFRRVP